MPVAVRRIGEADDLAATIDGERLTVIAAGQRAQAFHAGLRRPADAGVYHFNPAEVSLRLLRKGDFRGNLSEAAAMEPAVAHAPATIICTGTYWRNAWKYHTRTYRHFGWDNGTLLANMLAVAAASGLLDEIVLGFVGVEVNRLVFSSIFQRTSFSTPTPGLNIYRPQD